MVNRYLHDGELDEDDDDEEDEGADDADEEVVILHEHDPWLGCGKGKGPQWMKPCWKPTVEARDEETMSFGMFAATYGHMANVKVTSSSRQTQLHYSGDDGHVAHTHTLPR